MSQDIGDRPNRDCPLLLCQAAVRSAPSTRVSRDGRHDRLAASFPPLDLRLVASPAESPTPEALALVVGRDGTGQGSHDVGTPQGGVFRLGGERRREMQGVSHEDS
jgi:hypothetical protein